MLEIKCFFKTKTEETACSALRVSSNDLRCLWDI